jgi:hypothetical protein
MKSLTILRKHVKTMMAKNDPAHDFEHVLRDMFYEFMLMQKEFVKKKKQIRNLF